jgi:hypothetical protein
MKKQKEDNQKNLADLEGQKNTIMSDINDKQNIKKRQTQMEEDLRKLAFTII